MQQGASRIRPGGCQVPWSAHAEAGNPHSHHKAAHGRHAPKSAAPTMTMQASPKMEDLVRRSDTPSISLLATPRAPPATQSLAAAAPPNWLVRDPSGDRFDAQASKMRRQLVSRHHQGSLPSRDFDSAMAL